MDWRTTRLRTQQAADQRVGWRRAHTGQDACTGCLRRVEEPVGTRELPQVRDVTPGATLGQSATDGVANRPRAGQSGDFS